MSSHPEKQATILVVDDTSNNLNLLTTYFEASQFHVITAENGESALEQAKHFCPDLILLDIMMPGIDGFETCRRLKADSTTHDIPIIFMTGLTEKEPKIEGFKVGGVDYVTKPFYYEEVIARVKVHLTIRQLQQQLQQQNAQLHSLNSSKDQFLSIIANDLKKPFAEIFVAAEQIKHRLNEKRHDEAKHTVDHLQAAVENYHALLENLLIWAKVQQGILECVPQTLDLSHLVIRNIALLMPYAVEKQITISNLMPERFVLSADLTMIDTVVRNLLSNAIKFTKAGGAVRISGTQNEDTITVAVTDTGIGIPANKIPTLFQIDAKYQQVGTDDEKGTGLGLILCKEFLEKHGGTIWVESQLKQGSTFFFTLPKSPEK